MTKIDNQIMRVVKETLKELEDRRDIVTLNKFKGFVKSFLNVIFKFIFSILFFITNELIIVF